jgi:type II secretory pathway pseudopilin PulG
MDRLRSSSRGFTLLELLIASILGFIVVLAASNLMINFGKFTSTTIRAESSLMDGVLAIQEDIVTRITAANTVAILGADTLFTGVACPGLQCIQARVDQKLPAGCVNNCTVSPTDFTNDIIHIYWRDNNNIVWYRNMNLASNALSGNFRLGNGITNLSFTRNNPADRNQITITMDVQGASGSMGANTTEHMVTTATMRGSRG